VLPLCSKQRPGKRRPDSSQTSAKRAPAIEKTSFHSARPGDIANDAPGSGARRRPRFPARIFGVLALLAAAGPAPGQTAGGAADRVAALGRLEPEGGIVRVAAPATPLSLAGSVVAELRVAEGDDVTRGQLLAITDAEPALRTALVEAQTQLELEIRAARAAQSRTDEACIIAQVAAGEARRRASLQERQLAAEEEVEQSQGEATARAASCAAARVNAEVADAAIEVARARVSRRQAELDRAFVKAPFDGRILKVLAEPGEYVGPEGLLELGRVGRMHAIAEVHETEIRRIRPGQAATVSSEALEQDLSGKVRFIRPKVQKQDEIGTDPAARKDARIVEVGVLLDEPERAAALTNLQVEIVIDL
jgi:HlyD family secretion protein